MSRSLRIPLPFSLGLRHMVAAAFFFSLMSLFVKLAGKRIPTTEIVFARSLVSLVITWFMLRRAGVAPRGNRKGLLVLRGLTGLGGLLCFFFAISRLPLADVTVLHFTNPVFTTLLAAMILGETVGRRDVAGLALSLAGVVLVARPSFLFGAGAEPLDPLGVGAALLGALLAAGAYTTVRKLGQSEHHLVVVFYFPLIATPVSIPLMAHEAVWPTPLEWGLLLGVGIVTQIAQIHLTKGLHAEKAGKAMSMSYVQIVFAATWGILFFRDVPDLFTIGGALLVVAGTLLVAARRRTPASPAPGATLPR